ncbi:MAG TPA: hypothetical protein VGS22_11980 [Thermoanaerobaculia bacterium]|jgi:hypothetical protein|nr:hypothetical protein [Thermoanaerobaculia bacterium]
MSHRKRRPLRFLLLALAALTTFVAIGARSQQPEAPPQRSCDEARYREFDFLIGEWEAYSPDGKLAGRDRITPIYDGCALEEAWSGPVLPPKYRGGSVSAFDARSGGWHQTWVDNQGVTARMEGGLREGRMVLVGDAGSGAPGRRVRLTWEPQKKGEVRQTIEHAEGPEGIWTTATVLLYQHAGWAAIPLHYDERLAKAGFPSPAVRLKIGDRTAWFLVDSGAGVSTFASWFIESARLATETTATTMRDAAGRPVPLRVVRNITGTLADGSTLRIEAAGIADFPPLFEQNELGGLLSPQLLAPKGLAAVLDLRVPELRFEPFEAAVARLGAARISAAKVCEESGADLANRLYALPATVAGVPTSLLLDSGSTDTEVRRDSAVARSLAGRAVEGRSTVAISGGEEKRLRAAAVAVGFAETVRTLDVSIGAATSNCAPDGLLGIDALRSCAVVLGAKDLGVVCDAAGGGEPARKP